MKKKPAPRSEPVRRADRLKRIEDRLERIDLEIFRISEMVQWFRNNWKPSEGKMWK